MEPQPQKDKAGLQRREGASDLRRRVPENQSVADGRNRGAAYIPKPEFAEEEKKPAPTVKWKRWVILSAAAVVLGVAAVQIPQWMQPHNQTDFVLTAADVDQTATTNAREALRAGQIPPELSRYPKEVLQRIADGEESLYSKRLLPPEAAAMRIHVTVSNGGAIVGEDVLTPEHPATQPFPAGRDSPAQFHFTVERPGPSGQVTCWVNSANNGSIHTKAMSQGESDDLQARAQ